MDSVLTAVAVAALLAACAAIALGVAARRLAPREDALVARIDALLPQTQCGQCTYPGCQPYAQAIAAGKAGINQCPPGGDATAKALAELLGREAVAVDRRFGEVDRRLQVAVIDEETCIGCALCIAACPVDAIAGAAKHMHTIIARDCTGCGLCLPPCPVDCIELSVLDAIAGTARRPRAVGIRANAA
jgi:H+/Na+-translocating ferredoxin:NAD+ oxidoreductase subunit B